MNNREDKRNKILSVAKPCPFCGSTDLDISEKNSGHICVYCKNCNTYGPRVLEYGLFEDYRTWLSSKHHWFKTLKDMKNNSDGDKYHPIYVKKDDSEVTHDWYYEESVRRWNERYSKEGC